MSYWGRLQSYINAKNLHLTQWVVEADDKVPINAKNLFKISMNYGARL